VVDDCIPVDLFGRALVVGMRPLQLWPLLLSKAILKLMAAMRLLQFNLPHQVAAFQVRGIWGAVHNVTMKLYATMLELTEGLVYRPIQLTCSSPP